MKDILYALWSFRYFILSSIRTEFRSRFARSKLGGLWMILNPLAMVLIYTLVLSQIMTAKLAGVSTIYAYPIYILSGMMAWTLFSEVFSRSLNIFIDSSNLIKKINFPKLALPLIAVGTSLVNFFFLLITMFVVMFFLGHFPINALYWLPMLILLTLGLGLGIGLFFGILNVFIRDIGQILNIVLQFWFWLTPIVYMTSIIPDKYHWLIMLNPMTGVVMAYHKVLLYNSSPELKSLIYPFTIACISLILALIIFKKANEEMADLL